MKPIAYVTTDEVNAAHARELAEQCGMSLVVRHPSEATSRFPVVLVDWDSLSAQERARVVGQVDLQLSRNIVHSYNADFTREHPEFDRLRNLGYLVYRRLDEQVFLEMLSAKAA